VRIATRLAAAALVFALFAPMHVASKLLLGRSRWPRRFLAAATRIVGVRVTLVGSTPGPHSLLLANHLSWLDIVILGGSVGTAFVAKDNLGHGLLHWLADQNHTVYVRREHRKGARDQALEIAAALHRDQPVTVFPEGTTGPGTHLLPFRSTLIEAAAYAERDVEVRPVAIDYGPATAEVTWFQEPGLANVRRILGRKGRLPVTVHLLPSLSRDLDRKALALAAHDAVGRALAASSSAPARL
jgi:1-acyl-sn-glycerol-3-phosphate acyltransferase